MLALVAMTLAACGQTAEEKLEDARTVELKINSETGEFEMVDLEGEGSLMIEVEEEELPEPPAVENFKAPSSGPDRSAKPGNN